MVYARWTYIGTGGNSDAGGDNTGGNSGASGGTSAAGTNVNVRVNGRSLPATVRADGVLALVYDAEMVMRHVDATGIFEIDITGFTENEIHFNIPALGGDDLVVRTDFGRIEVSNDTLRFLQSLYGDTLRLVIAKGSFKVALMDNSGKEIMYNNPAHPFTIVLPYTLPYMQDANSVVAVKKNVTGQTILPVAIYSAGEIAASVGETGIYDVIHNVKQFTDSRQRRW